MPVITEFKEGDVFQFSYSDVERAKARTDLHWCFDGQVVYQNGRLCDTYWGFSGGDRRVVSPDQGELTFVCNLSDVRDIRQHETRHYLETDVFNLSYQHGCYKRFVVRKDAQPSAERMLWEIGDKERAVRREMELAVSSGATTLLRLGELKARIDAGDLSKKPWW